LVASGIWFSSPTSARMVRLLGRLGLAERLDLPHRACELGVLPFERRDRGFLEPALEERDA